MGNTFSALPTDASAPAADWRVAATIELPNRRGVALRLRLASGMAGYVAIRDGDRLEDPPISHFVLGPFYPYDVAWRRRRLRGIRKLIVQVGAADAVEVEFRLLGWRDWAQRVWRRRFRPTRGLSVMAHAGRSPEYAPWHRRYNQPQARELRAMDLGGSDGPIAAYALEPLSGGARRLEDGAPDPGLVSLHDIRAMEASISLLVEQGAQAEPYAAQVLAAWLNRHPEAAAAFADCEAPDEDGVVHPVFSSRFDALTARAAPGVQVRGILAVNWRNMPALEGTGAPATLEALAAAAGEGRVGHVPLVLSKLARLPRQDPGVLPRSFGALGGRREAISILIPSRDNPVMLERAVRTLHETAHEFDLRFVVIDHASAKAETAACLTRLRRDFPLDVVRAEGGFNFARLMNVGRAAAAGEFLFSVNDDIEATNGEWLAPMIALLRDPACGAVGPRLLYPDGRIQHAGVVIGLDGVAGHAGRLCSLDDRGLSSFGGATRAVGAVTGAVLGVRAAVCDEAGGWGERLEIEYNDIDFCLKIAALGLRNVYCAQSVMLHHESVSRGDGKGRAFLPRAEMDRNAFIEMHWRDLAHDPFYPPNLSMSGTALKPAFPPRRPNFSGILDYPGW